MRHSPHPAQLAQRNVSRDARLVRSIGPLWQRVADGTRTPTSRALPCDGHGSGGTWTRFDARDLAAIGTRPPDRSQAAIYYMLCDTPPPAWTYGMGLRELGNRSLLPVAVIKHGTGKADHHRY